MKAIILISLMLLHGGLVLEQANIAGWREAGGAGEAEGAGGEKNFMLVRYTLQSSLGGLLGKKELTHS